MNVWKGRFLHPQSQRYNREEKDIEKIAEAGDQYAQVCFGLMCNSGQGVKNLSVVENDISNQRLIVSSVAFLFGTKRNSAVDRTLSIAS